MPNNALSFLDFLAEKQDYHFDLGEYDSMLAGWTNIRTGQTVSDRNLSHGALIGRHWEDFGLSKDEVLRLTRRQGLTISQQQLDANTERALGYALDGEYGRFYDDGWIRWFIFRQRGQGWPKQETSIQFTSSVDTLRRGKAYITALAKQVNPDRVLITNQYDHMHRAPGSLVLTLDGEEVKRGKFHIDSVTEAYPDPSEETDGGWFNVYTGKRVDSYTEEPHWRLIVQHWRDFGYESKEEAKGEATDAHYGTEYTNGWVRYFFEPQHRTLVMSSSEDVLRDGRKMIERLIQELQPWQIWLSNQYEEGPYIDPDYTKVLGQDEIRKVRRGGRLEL